MERGTMNNINFHSNILVEYDEDMVWFNGLGNGYEIFVNGILKDTSDDLNRGIIEFGRWLAIIGFIVTDTDFVVRG
jgi:hypothetical protein